LNYLIEEKNKTNCEIFNLGTGNGYTVIEVINTFEKVSEQKLNYSIAGRRSGDIIGIYANNEKAQQILGWVPKYNLEDMMLTAWNWEKKLANKNSI
jgi:UDP-glucose 4-epimerase